MVERVESKLIPLCPKLFASQDLPASVCFRSAAPRTSRSASAVKPGGGEVGCRSGEVGVRLDLRSEGGPRGQRRGVETGDGPETRVLWLCSYVQVSCMIRCRFSRLLGWFGQLGWVQSLLEIDGFHAHGKQ